MWTRRCSDHGREEGKGDPEGAFRADLAYFEPSFRLNPPLLSAQRLVNSLDTTSCCFHLAFPFPLNARLPPDLNLSLIYPGAWDGPARAHAHTHLHTRTRGVTQGHPGVNTAPAARRRAVLPRSGRRLGTSATPGAWRRRPRSPRPLPTTVPRRRGRGLLTPTRAGLRRGREDAATRTAPAFGRAPPPRDAPSVSGSTGTAGARTPVPPGPGHGRTAQPDGGGRRSQSPLLPDGRHAAPPAPPRTCSPRRAPSPSPAATPRGSRAVGTTTPGRSSAASPRIGPGCARTAGRGRGHAGAGRGGAPGGSLAPPGGRGARAPGPRIPRVPPTPRSAGAAAPAWSASALEGTVPRGCAAAAGGAPSATDPPRVRCGGSRGAEARPRPRRTGGRSRREAWGGGFGEGGERGSSDELLPSLTATQRPTSSSYFYFLWVLLTFKMPAPLVRRRAPGPPPLCKKAGFQHRTSSPLAAFPPLLRRWLSLGHFSAPEAGGRGHVQSPGRPSSPLPHPRRRWQEELSTESRESLSCPKPRFHTYKMGVRKLCRQPLQGKNSLDFRINTGQG